jgi:hypothetical protein
MYRDEAVALMTKTVNDYNRTMASGAGITHDQIESVIEQQQPQLNTVNGMLYDVLKANGVIL